MKVKKVQQIEIMEEITHLHWVGSKIRELRQQRQMTLDQFAAVSGVSIGLLSQIERGIGNPSFLTLINIADAFGVPVGYLFQEPNDHKCQIVRRNRRQKLLLEDSNLVVELLTSDISQPVQLLWIERGPGESTEHRPSQHRGAEVGVVTKGNMEIHVDDEMYVLKEGDSISIPPYVTHWYQNPTKEWVIYICAIASSNPISNPTIP